MNSSDIIYWIAYFMDDPLEARLTMYGYDSGLHKRDLGDMFALVVFLADRYLSIKPGAGSSVVTVSPLWYQWWWRHQGDEGGEGSEVLDDGVCAASGLADDPVQCRV